MSIQFRPAKRENCYALIGFCGGTGSGKTWSAMEVAAGISGDKPFAVADTEAGRAKFYANRFRFDHADVGPPFTPEKFTDVVKTASDAKYSVLVVDSFSHEHAGEGGVLDMHEEEVTRMCRGNDNLREVMQMPAWIKPKMRHKAMVQRMLQSRLHIIFCLRAEEKVEIAKENGKTVIRPMKSPTGMNGWIPVCAKTFPYELSASFLFMADRPGVPIPIKPQEDLTPIFNTGRQVTSDCGRLLDEWAHGMATAIPQPAGERLIDADGAAELRTLLEQLPGGEAEFLRIGKLARLEDMPAARFDRSIEWLVAKIAEMAAATQEKGVETNEF